MSTATSPTIASLTVTAGPDRGKVVSLQDEFIHIGRAEDCHLVLTDPQLDEVQASLANRNGRFAIITSLENSVAVDGRTLPAEQWAWLPAQAAIKVSQQTTLLFSCGLPSVSGSGDAVAAKGGASKALATPPNVDLNVSLPAKPKPRKGAGKKGEGTARTVAKFITDRTGETLVKLGEDGHLPELSLNESAAPKLNAKRQNKAQGNPALVYAALGFSVLMSLAMLFMDMGVTGERTQSKSNARQAVLREFVGDDSAPIKPYQQLLRDAGLAYSRGDLRSERSAYQRVLKLLNSEDKNPFTGITGDIEKDDELKKYLAVLLGQ